MKSPHPEPSPTVAAIFRACPPAVREKLLRLRKIVLDTATKMDGVGAVEETLKWSQPAYLVKVGSTIRIDAVKSDPKRVAMYFICHTDLIATFRELYPGFTYDGNRAILLKARGKIPEDALRHCISLALSYRARKPVASAGAAERYAHAVIRRASENPGNETRRMKTPDGLCADDSGWPILAIVETTSQTPAHPAAKNARRGWRDPGEPILNRRTG